MDGNFTYLEGLDQEKLTTSSFNATTGSFATTGSNVFVGNQTITGSLLLSSSAAVELEVRGNSLFSGSLLVSGSISQVGVGAGNTILGFGTGASRTTAACNTIIGNLAGCSVNMADCNTFIGFRAGACEVSGFDNVAIGFQAGEGTTALASSQNTTIGACAGRSGQRNVAIGRMAGSQLNGQGNVVIGQGAHPGSNSNCTIAIGENAGTVISGLGTANSSIFIGVCTGAPGSGQTNQIVMGHCATGNGSNTTTIGNSSTTATYLRGTLITSGSVAQQAIGSFLLSGSLTISGSISQVGIGTNNTFIGNNAGISRTTGTCNTLIGRSAGQSLTTANSTTIIGSNAGDSVTTGDTNTFIGTSAGQAITTGNANVALGSNALFSNVIGVGNTAIGETALTYATTGSGNVALGMGAGSLLIDSNLLTSADSSIFIGEAVKSKANGQTNEIIIGGFAEGEGSNTTVIGNANTVDTYLKGTLNVTRQILSEVSSSLNFVDDAAASAGGVPLGGLYRNGNFILIRLT